MPHREQTVLLWSQALFRFFLVMPSMLAVDAVLDDLDLPPCGCTLDTAPLPPGSIALPMLLLLLRLFTISFTTAAMGLPVPRGDACCMRGDRWAVLGVIERGEGWCDDHPLLLL